MGLTVKELTYEVRQALLVPDAIAPLVVADMDAGTPAAVARIQKYDLILKLNDTDIDGIESYKAAIDESRTQSGSEPTTMRFTLQRLGETRFTDVALE